MQVCARKSVSSRTQKVNQPVLNLATRDAFNNTEIRKMFFVICGETL